MARAHIAVKKVTASDLRDRLKDYLEAAEANRVVLVENRRQKPKYLVDKAFLDSLMKEHESVIATLEILADRDFRGSDRARVHGSGSGRERFP